MDDIWILYRTTNNVNGKIYVGVHKVADTWDSRKYLGSGNAIKTAIKKYGRDNFTRTTLAEFNSAEEAFKAEYAMVTDEFVNRPDTYNISLGGLGGVKGTPEMIARASNSRRGKVCSEEHRAKISAALKGKTFSDEHKAKLSIARTGMKMTEATKEKLRARLKGNQYTKGSTVSAETKAKISAANKGRVLSAETIANRTGAKHYRSMPVLINGEYYESVSAAAKAVGKHVTTTLHRIKNTNPEWSDWCFV